MLVFIGGGANGKSILMEFIQRHLFGPDQTCCLPPDEWRGFMKARLDGPLINLVPELDERSVFANAAFKSALAGEPMTTDVKNKASYEFRPRAGHVFAANQMPPATDHTVGFLRRFIMIGFNRSYLHDPTRREPREILADLAEIAPVVRARCIWACAAALKNRGYTVPEEHQTLIREWSIRSNTYKHFCESVLVEAPGMIEQSRMFKAYTEFCGAVGNRAGGSRKFYEELSLLGYQRSAPNQSKRRYFEGLGIKPREEWGDGSAQNDEWL
jgi:putative DNA primase/helicase